MGHQRLPKVEFDAERLIVRLDLTVAGHRESVGPAVARIMKVVREMGCAAGHEADLEVVLHEALANAVVHGCQGDPRREAQVAVACDESRGVMIVVRDPGEGFDPAAVPSPLIGENLYAERGRGIFLINQLMDEVRFERGGTELWMRKG